jgi:adenylate cyclase
MGRPSKAREKASEAVKLSRELGHTHTLAVSLFFEIKISQFCGDVGAVLDKCAELIKLCSAEGFALWRIGGEAFEGWALTKSGSAEGGLVQLQAAIRNWEKTGAGLFLVYWFALLADVFAARNRLADGLRVLDDALKICDKNEERWWEVDIVRRKGELLLAQGNQDSAESCFQQARRLAKKQNALSLELRSVIGLAELLSQQQRNNEALTVLHDVYDKFAEGFETSDLVRAQKLLKSLSSRS